jgi:hypothetical protein
MGEDAKQEVNRWKEANQMADIPTKELKSESTVELKSEHILPVARAANKLRDYFGYPPPSWLECICIGLVEDNDVIVIVIKNEFSSINLSSLPAVWDDFPVHYRL